MCQLDDTNFAFLCDPKLADTFRRDGYEPDEMPDAASRISSIRPIPERARRDGGRHPSLPRNSMAQWAARGGYATRRRGPASIRSMWMAYFLEYDASARAGFEPPALFSETLAQRIVLGLLSTKCLSSNRRTH